VQWVGFAPFKERGGDLFSFAGVFLPSLGKVSFGRLFAISEQKSFYSIINRLQKFIHSKKVSRGGVMRQANVKQIFSLFFLAGRPGKPVGKSGWNQNRLSVLRSRPSRAMACPMAQERQKSLSLALAL